MLRITYTSPVRGHQFHYARELHKMGCMHAFITGSPRWGHGAALPELGSRLIRRDSIQTLHLLSLRYKLPDRISYLLGKKANAHIDRSALPFAEESDIFLYYRTTGMKTANKLHASGSKTTCVMEEVNSHYDHLHTIMRREFEEIGLGKYPSNPDKRELILEAYAGADYILCPSEFVRRSFAEKGFSPDRLIKVNFGFNISVQDQNLTQKPTKEPVFRLLFVGQIHYRKGLRHAIEAFKRLKHPRKEFWIVGPITKTPGITTNGQPDGVKFTGILKGEELSKAYNMASAFVLPTLEEGQALVLGEAMAAGLPIVTTTHSGGDDLLVNRKEGFIVPPADAEALLEAFQELAESPDVAAKMGRAARMRAQELGGWDVATSNLVHELEKICNMR